MRMLDKLIKSMGTKKTVNKFKNLAENLKGDLLKNLTEGNFEIPAIPFKVPEFEIAGLKIDLNDKEKINAAVGVGRDIL